MATLQLTRIEPAEWEDIQNGKRFVVLKDEFFGIKDEDGNYISQYQVGDILSFKLGDIDSKIMPQPKLKFRITFINDGFVDGIRVLRGYVIAQIEPIINWEEE